jgi:hypothetical protein
MKKLIKSFLLIIFLQYPGLLYCAEPMSFDPPCPSSGGKITTPLPSDDCSAQGILSEILYVYEVGVCTNRPIANASGTDLSSCKEIFKSSSPLAVDVISEPSLPGAQLPPTGNYSYTYLIISSTTDLKAKVTFDNTVTGHSSSGKDCFTRDVTVFSSGADYDSSYQIIPTVSGGSNNYSVECSDSPNPLFTKINNQYIGNGSSFPYSTYVNLLTPLGTSMEVYFVNDLLKRFVDNPTGDNKNIGVTKLVLVFDNNLNILNNESQNNQICSTSGLDLQVNVSKGLYISSDGSSNPNLIFGMGIGAFYYGFATQPISCSATN